LFGLLQKKHSRKLLFPSISQFDFANPRTATSNKQEKRFTKREEKSWLPSLLVKCKYGKMASKENRRFCFHGVVHGVVATRGLVLLGTTPLKCSRHLALKFFKVVWLKDARFSQRCTLVLHIQSVPKGGACPNKSRDWSAACTFFLPSDYSDGLRIKV